ncbi:MarR family winged helix-turn-helix transcriptional regulator [Sneathiella sp. P13V-1]|uniref:MarR family winged helix-turn-helix transcriptional regulator n=1 Tax=Sneathiella sp. P13V-1 TaxID=2697366 RepID=UPI002AB294D6|nr:winged helix DNA-binding protein [Sneathiella sp. P13V-1]
MVEDYREMTRLIERLHRRFLDVVRVELDQIGVKDINAVQALLLVNIGEEEVNVRELMARGYYQGSNASYNLKKLEQKHYLIQEKSERDRRATMIRLSEKGLDLIERLNKSEEAQAQKLANSDPAPDMKLIRSALRQIERIWADQIHFGI